MRGVNPDDHRRSLLAGSLGDRERAYAQQGQVTESHAHNDKGFGGLGPGKRGKKSLPRHGPSQELIRVGRRM